jgi:hypothetical protein
MKIEEVREDQGDAPHFTKKEERGENARNKLLIILARRHSCSKMYLYRTWLLTALHFK